MNGLRDALVGGDPVAREGGLSAADADEMRRVVVAAAASDRELASWPRPMFVAATLAATLAIGIIGGSRLPRSEPTRHPITTANSSDAAPTLQVAERRQLQFATPGGTRIIWVFDPEFNP